VEIVAGDLVLVELVQSVVVDVEVVCYFVYYGDCDFVDDVVVVVVYL